MTDRSVGELKEILRALEDLDYVRTYRKFEGWTPYPKQRRFFELGATKRERLFMAGNQVGKSDAGAFEAACHLTGEYPKWWTGKRFDHPTVGWMAGVTSLDVRNVQQKKLCGPPGVDAEFGTGLIPREAFADKPSLSRGVTDAFDQILVYHKTGGAVDGISRGIFKSYEQGRKSFQGDTVHWGWCDEEPEKKNVYDEFLTRLTGDGIMYMTFTPLFGPTDLVNSFHDGSSDKGVISMSLDDAEHFTAEQKARRLAGYAHHEREARAKGIPKLGAGAIFLTPEERVVEPPLSYIPVEWVKGWGIDFGIGHPFGAALCLWDRDNDIVHVHYAFRISDALSLVHAQHMKRIGASVPVFWPKDGANRDPHGGEPLADGYRKHGLLMHHEHAAWPDGSLSTEAGITEWDERERTGKIKFAAHLSELLEERRFYHRKEDGQIVKLRDDILSGVRIFLMMKRFARAVPLGGTRKVAISATAAVARDVDFDLFA